MAFCRKRPDVISLMDAELEPARGHRGSTSEERRDRDDNIISIQGTAATYTLKRLKRDAPELYRRVVDRELSANAAAIEAPDPDPDTPDFAQWLETASARKKAPGGASWGRTRTWLTAAPDRVVVDPLPQRFGW